jgi:serine beta-lactamase-like protein LACTB
MEKTKSRIPGWLMLAGFVICLPFLVAGVIWEYMSATATPLHPNAASVPAEGDSAALPKWDKAVEQARQQVRADLVERNLPGLSVAVGIRGEIVWAEGFGWADLENRTKVTPETRFRIGTASTALTSVAVGLLLEEGRLLLDEKIQTYVPEFPEKQWPVTLRQLMAHVSGVGNDGGDEGPLLSQHCERPVDALPAFAEGRLRFEPGAEYRYSQYGWILISAALESAAKEPFLGLMQKRVFEPLGLLHTGADPAKLDAPSDEDLLPPFPGLANSYFPRYSADPRYGPDPMRALDYSCYAGSSVFVSTPSDLARFAMAIHRGKLLKPATVKLLQTAFRLPSGEETGYGLGWDRETVMFSGKPTSLVGHDGDLLGGMAVTFMTFPEHELTVSVAANTSYADTFSIAVKIAQVFAEKGK